MTITITKGAKGVGEWCDRRSPLGNPFMMRHANERDRVCDAYQDYFDWMVKTESAWIDAVKMSGEVARKHDATYSLRFDIPAPNLFITELDRLSTILKAQGALTLKCWCIDAQIKSVADLERAKRCHCLSIARHLLPSVGGFTEQLTLGV